MRTEQQQELTTKSSVETSQLHASGRSDWLILGGFALVALVVHLVFYKGYGFFRDELYFIACGKHLAWGYVDHPPGTPFIAWASQKILGDTLFAIRFVPILFAVAQLVVTGLTARVMGGGRYAQLLTCLCVFGAPQYFGTWLNTDMFMDLGWAACAWVATRIFAGESQRLWLLFGLFAGLALQGKHAMLFFLIAFFVGIAVSPQRNLLLTRWPWYGAVIAFLIALPNIIWEYTHHWATYELLSNIAKSDKNIVLGPWPYLKSNLDSLGMLTVLVWIPGLIWCLFLKGGKGFRALGWTWIFSFILFIVLKGKTYYLTPVYPMLFAAGSVAIESGFAQTPHLVQSAVKPAFAIIVFLRAAIGWPFAMPMMPVEKFIAYEHALHAVPERTETVAVNELPQQYADMFGWPELAATVAKVYHSIPAGQRESCGIYGKNYGEAAAIDYFGPRLGLPHAISGHQSYWFWGPAPYSGDCMILIGKPPAVLGGMYDSVTQVAETTQAYAMPYENHRPIFLCRGKKFSSLQDLWPQMKFWI
jgi:hypothetical protein